MSSLLPFFDKPGGSSPSQPFFPLYPIPEVYLHYPLILLQLNPEVLLKRELQQVPILNVLKFYTLKNSFLLLMFCPKVEVAISSYNKAYFIINKNLYRTRLLN